MVSLGDGPLRRLVYFADRVDDERRRKDTPGLIRPVVDRVVGRPLSVIWMDIADGVSFPKVMEDGERYRNIR